jgi:hypothetical protein
MARDTAPNLRGKDREQGVGSMNSPKHDLNVVIGAFLGNFA